MRIRLLLVFALLSALALPAVAQKRAVVAARLLLPLYEVDVPNPFGASTFFSVRNEITQPVEVRISYYAADRPQSPFLTETVSLPGKKLLSVDVASKLEDEDPTRGFVILETVSGDAVIQGDYFQVTPEEDFATGSRLVNIDPQSENNDLCSVFTIRLLNGGLFDGGTEYVFWLDLDVAPEETAPVATYSVYNEAGDLRFFTDLFATEVAFRESAAALVSIIPTNFGAIEFQFADGIRGHVAAVMSALGRYSVGLEAACGD